MATLGLRVTKENVVLWAHQEMPVEDLLVKEIKESLAKMVHQD